MLVQCDQLRLKQILMNIQSNALKFTKDGGEVNIVCQYVRGCDKKQMKVLFNKGESSDQIRRMSIGDEEINHSADSDQDFMENDRATQFVNLNEKEEEDSHFSTSKIDSN
jgi:hypothetical protein